MNRLLRILTLAALLFAKPLFAQNPGVTPLKSNAIEHLYQYPPQWQGLTYSDERPFGERLYIVGGAVTGYHWRNSTILDQAPSFVGGRLGAGYQIAPVHSVEAGLGLRKYDALSGLKATLDLSYLFNVSSYASRLEDSERYDIFLKAGTEVEFSEGANWKANAGARFKYNISPSVGFYVEPLFGVGSNRANNYTFLEPSVSFGTTIQTARVRDAVNRSIDRRNAFLEETGFHIVTPMAIKTNLLFDVATVANVGIEVPVASRWSIAADWMFPWWLWEDEQHCLQILSGNLEARYWLTSSDKYERPHTNYNPLAGWFVGLYGGAGLYDLEWDKVGYQGEFYIATGVSLGYVHQLSRSLLLEFSAGVGYLSTDYRKYEAKFSQLDDQWHLVREFNGAYTWFGPTSAKISLSWYPHFRKKGDRKR